MSWLRNWITLSIGITFITTTVSNFGTISIAMIHNIPCSQISVKDTFIVFTNLLVAIPIITYNVYHLCKLYECMYRSSYQESVPISKIPKSFARLSTVFIISWIICYIQQSYLFIYGLECFGSFSDMIYCPVVFPSMLGIFTFTIIGIECSKWKQFISLSSTTSSLSDANIFSELGSSFILFNLKWYSIALAGISATRLSFYIIFQVLPWNEVHEWWGWENQELQFETYIWPMFIFNAIALLLAIVLWFLCHLYNKQLISYQNNFLQHNNNIKMDEDNYERSLSKLYLGYISMLSYWKKYKFW
eukprot:528511_1